MRATCACWLIALGITTGTAQARGPVLTATAYRAKASAICRALKSYAPPNSGTITQRFAALVSEARSTTASLRSLRPPPSLAPLHSKVVALETRDVNYFTSVLAQNRAGTLSTGQVIAALAKAPSGLQEDQIWRKLGVPACVQG